jgi:hypothetical protein
MKDAMARANMRRNGFMLPILVSGLLVFATGACAPAVDLTTGLQVQVVATGWLRTDTVSRQNRLVPVVSFRLKNMSDQRLNSLRVNALFYRVGDVEEWGNGFLTAAGSDGLVAGASTQTLTIKSQLGYTGTDPLPAMLENSRFVDAKVDLFAKYGSTDWARLGEYSVVRQLLFR